MSFSAALLLYASLATQPTPTRLVLDAYDEADVVALGENHGHAEFHDFVFDLLQDPEAIERIDDIAVEWGNALYQDVMDRYVAGGSVPWDSVTMAWRNTVVSPNTVWDAPTYEAFFRRIRHLNAGLAPTKHFRVVLADAPVDWSAVDSIQDLRPFFDRARAMAETIQSESLERGRSVLFLAGGLHVARQARSWPNQDGSIRTEHTPISLLEQAAPGSTASIQSMGRAEQLGLDAFVRSDGPHVLYLRDHPELADLPGNEATTLRNRDGSKPNVYGSASLGQVVDGVVLWGPDQLTFPETAPATYESEWYWEELNRRSMMLRGEPMSPELRGS